MERRTSRDIFRGWKGERRRRVVKEDSGWGTKWKEEDYYGLRREENVCAGFLYRGEEKEDVGGEKFIRLGKKLKDHYIGLDRKGRN